MKYQLQVVSTEEENEKMRWRQDRKSLLIKSSDSK